MAAAKGALEEGEGGSAEAGAELGEDGDGYAEVSGAGECNEQRSSSPPLRWGKAVDDQTAPARPWPLNPGLIFPAHARGQ